MIMATKKSDEKIPKTKIHKYSTSFRVTISGMKLIMFS